MGIRSALYAYLTGWGALTTALGATADLPKVYPHAAFAGEAFPYVTFKRMDEPGERTLREGSIRVATFVLNAWSLSTDECEAIVEVLRPALEQFHGEQAAHGVWVSLCKPIGEEDEDVPPDDASDARWYFTTITARITYKALS